MEAERARGREVWEGGEGDTWGWGGAKSVNIVTPTIKERKKKGAMRTL